MMRDESDNNYLFGQALAASFQKFRDMKNIFAKNEITFLTFPQIVHKSI